MFISRLTNMVIPKNAVEETLPQDFLDAFGVKPPAGDPPADPPADPPPADPPKDEPPADPPKDNPPADPPKDEPVPPAVDKQAQAFAAMRVQNKNYENLLKGVAGLLGIENVDKPEAISEALNAKIMAKQAEKQNVPVELLQRMNTLEQESAAIRAERIQAAAVLGFQKVMTDFKLDQTALTQYADSLLKDGINPFEQEVNVYDMYKLRNFDSLLAAAREQGIREEQERAAKAAASSSAPNGNQGQSGGEPGKINTVSALTSFFDKMSN